MHIQSVTAGGPSFPQQRRRLFARIQADIRDPHDGAPSPISTMGRVSSAIGVALFAALAVASARFVVGVLTLRWVTLTAPNHISAVANDGYVAAQAHLKERGLYWALNMAQPDHALYYVVLALIPGLLLAWFLCRPIGRERPYRAWLLTANLILAALFVLQPDIFNWVLSVDP